MRRLLPFLLASLLLDAASEWSKPAEVRHDDKLVLTYQARLEGEYVVVRAVIEPGWHTFVMDNKTREQEKLAGKPSLGTEKDTAVTVVKGLATSGPWMQAQPKDLSQPAIRHFTWGYEKEAMFAAKVRRTGAGPAEIQVTGQACAADICKNIEVTLALPVGKGKVASSDSSLELLIPVKAQ